MNTSGNPTSMVCGKTGINEWTYPWIDKKIVRIEVDTSAANFPVGDVLYLTSIGGSTQHFYTKGASSIYDSDNDSFVLYVVYEWTEPDFIINQRASEWGWYINWCGISI
jgi:hypothetical protein